MCITDQLTAPKLEQATRLMSGVGSAFADVDIHLHTLARDEAVGHVWTRDDADRVDDLRRAYLEKCRDLDEAQRILAGVERDELKPLNGATL